MKRLSAADAVLKKELDRWYKKTNRPEFIPGDPVKFPRYYANPTDIEIAAFLAAVIAWGRRDLILRSAERMFALMGPSLIDFVMSCRELLDGNASIRDSGGYSDNYNKPKGRSIHRTFFEDDLRYFCRGFKACHVKYGSLEKIFSGDPDIWKGIGLFRTEMAAANGGHYTRHIANPGGLSPETLTGYTQAAASRSGSAKGMTMGSACKRLHLALRWLVREGPVDLGLWKNIPPSALYIPLDLHVARSARRLGLLDRKSNDKKAVIALTEKLREFCPEDPVKYDFALFALSQHTPS